MSYFSGYSIIMTKSRASIKRSGSHKATSRKRVSKQSKQRRTSRRTSRRMDKTKNGGFNLFGVDKKEYVKKGLEYLNTLNNMFINDNRNDTVNAELVSATEYYINKINKVDITYENGKKEKEIDTFIHGELCKNILDIKYFYIKLAIGLTLGELKTLLDIFQHKNINELVKYNDSISNTINILYTINKNKDYINEHMCVIDDKEIMQIRETLLKESQ